MKLDRLEVEVSGEGQRIVVVGSCASGKSTLVAALRESGIDAYACAQEHSEIPTLWNHYKPDFVVLLETDLRTIRMRRSPNWPANIYRTQRRRLTSARSAADVIIDTASIDVPTAVERVIDGLNGSIQNRNASFGTAGAIVANRSHN